MPKFLIDENLPYNFSLWNSEDFIHIYDLKDIRTDTDIWNYAKNNNLIIVTKDADFLEMMLINEPPPKVVHLRIGNYKISELFYFLNRIWIEIENLVKDCKLINIYSDRIESIR